MDLRKTIGSLIGNDMDCFDYRGVLWPKDRIPRQEQTSEYGKYLEVLLILCGHQEEILDKAVDVDVECFYQGAGDEQAQLLAWRDTMEQRKRSGDCPARITKEYRKECKKYRQKWKKQSKQWAEADEETRKKLTKPPDEPPVPLILSGMEEADFIEPAFLMEFQVEDSHLRFWDVDAGDYVTAPRNYEDLVRQASNLGKKYRKQPPRRIASRVEKEPDQSATRSTDVLQSNSGGQEESEDSPKQNCGRFKDTGTGYLAFFEEGEWALPRTEGARIVQILLRSRNVEVSWYSLAQGPPPDELASSKQQVKEINDSNKVDSTESRSPDGIYASQICDDKALKEIRAREKELERQIDDPDNQLDPDRHAWQEEKDNLSKKLRASFNRRGKPRSSSSQRKRIRDRVQTAKDRFITSIPPGKLSDHFKESIKDVENGLLYCPKDDVDWSF